jgi:hypothetical protein
MSDKRSVKNDAAAGGLVRQVAAAGASVVAGKLYTLLAAFMMAFAGVFLLIGWQFGVLPMAEAREYAKFTAHVDARIVESWIALEFDPTSVRNPEFWRASANAAGCIVAEYEGGWGAPIRRAYCGIRTGFNESWPVAKLREISVGIPFAWARDANGFVVPELRVDPATKQWLAAHAPNRFMHDKWPAVSTLDWLRLEIDDPVALAVAGWTTPPPMVKLSFDPAKPGEALPDGIIAARLAAGVSLLALVVGFGIGLVVWFKGAALLPLVQDLTATGRWFVSALPLLTLPWWMDAFAPVLSVFDHDLGMIVGDMYADIGRIDRLIASEPAQATLANGERLVWTMKDSVYADTFARFRFVPPGAPYASEALAFAALQGTITAQVRALDDAQRGELFAMLGREKDLGLDAAAPAFKPAAEEAAADANASAATRRAAQRLLR